VQHGAGQPRVEVRSRDAPPERTAVPFLDGARCGGGLRADRRQVVGGRLSVRVGIGAERQHRAAVKVKHQLPEVIDRRHPQGRHPGGSTARANGILPQANHFRAGEQTVSDHREPVEHQTAVEQVWP
jgi:hypothetical protein